MWKYCGIILICFLYNFARVSSKCGTGGTSGFIPGDETGVSVNISQLNGTVWQPFRHYGMNDPRFNIFHSSPYLQLDCVEFHFVVAEDGILIDILPINHTDETCQECWMEHFIARQSAMVIGKPMLTQYNTVVGPSPSNCERNDVNIYFLTTDFDKILVLLGCYDFSNGTVKEGIWVLSRPGIEIDFNTFRQTRKLIDSAVDVSSWIPRRETVALCTCQTRFASPCFKDEDCIKKDSSYHAVNDNNNKILTASMNYQKNFLMWFFIGVITFAAGIFAFIHFSGVYDCLCSENYNAF